MHACVHIWSACDDLNVVSILAAVYFTCVKMCSLHLGTFFYNADNDTVDLSGEIDQFLYLESAAEKLIL